MGPNGGGGVGDMRDVLFVISSVSFLCCFFTEDII